ncbi:hypothetical protein SLEP1_g40775 [Rubroshorea leprosula]|uniref:Bromo domain-containing protein n=1 Tax=Rubroshorea leprosula TaxID=152421 RepID=A0AAV5L4X2_9ROSI|nr:hypothetical protein SLEP1_g40775 [Rubroshorea leprosula]
MKRKRGHKKGSKQKAPATTAPSEAVVNVVSEEDDSGQDETESGMEVGTPSSTGTDQPLVNLVNIKSDGPAGKALGNLVGRVKVKLKTPRALDSDVPSHSDTEKGSPKVGLERQDMVTKKVEDSGNLAGERKMAFSGIVYRKSGKIKIKSSMKLGDSSVDKGGAAVLAQGETSLLKEQKVTNQDSRYNKQELGSAMAVIKKVMKMEAAAPFNEPVDPEALGIPDYLDIIDTPMDFGTICSNLEKGDKYMNSEDVFKDVQYIWDNCCKYNNKGDAIMDLMKRVKKNFMKYWSAASLYSEQSRGTNGAENLEVEDGAQGKAQTKASQSKIKNKKHGYFVLTSFLNVGCVGKGFSTLFSTIFHLLKAVAKSLDTMWMMVVKSKRRRHKSDCLCAVCVLKRRKREREANARLAKGQSGVQELKQEESSPVESPGNEDSSLNNGESADLDEDAEVEDKREKVKAEANEQQYSPMEESHGEEEEEDENEDNEIRILGKDEGERKQLSQLGSSLAEEPSRQSQPEIVDKSAAVAQSEKESTLVKHEEQSEKRHKESQERQDKAKMLNSFYHENPVLLNLCETLFPNNQNSVWRGPHSIFQHQGSSQTSSIQAAIETFMK